MRTCMFGDKIPPIVPSLRCLNSIKHENNKKQYCHENLFKSLQILNCDSIYKNALKFIGFDPFFVLYWTDQHESVYNHYSKIEGITVVIDATGSLIQSPHKHNGYPYLYTICTKPKNERSFNTAYLISTIHNAEFLAFMFFKNFLKKFALPKQIVVDESPGLIAAIVQSFTSCKTIKDYLKVCFSFLQGYDKNIPEVLIKLDIAHFVKTIHRSQVLKKMDIRVRQFYLRVIGYMTKIKDFAELKTVTRLIFCLLLNAYGGEYRFINKRLF